MVSNLLSETRGAGFTHPLSFAALLSASTRPCVSFAIYFSSVVFRSVYVYRNF